MRGEPGCEVDLPGAMGRRVRQTERPELEKPEGFRVRSSSTVRNDCRHGRSSSTEGASCDSLQRMEAQDAMVR